MLQKLYSSENVREPGVIRSMTTAIRDRCDESKFSFLPPTTTVTGWKVAMKEEMEAGTSASWTRPGKDAECQHYCNFTLKLGNL